MVDERAVSGGGELAEGLGLSVSILHGILRFPSTSSTSTGLLIRIAIDSALNLPIPTS